MLTAPQAAEQIKRIYKLFLSVDAVQVEVNPFGETPDGQGTAARWLSRRRPRAVVSFDAKINFDDNAAFRQKAIFDQRDTAEEVHRIYRDMVCADCGRTRARWRPASTTSTTLA